MKGDNRADRLAGKATLTSGLLLGRSEVLRSLRHYLRALSQGHHTIDYLEERGVERGSAKLLASVYDILLSTTAVFSYAIGSRKLSANEQFFVGAQTVVSLLQTTQIKQGRSIIAANKVYTSTNKTTIV